MPDIRPRTVTFDVAGGRIVLPDVSGLVGAPAILARKRDVEGQLRATRHVPERATERAALRLENEALDRRLADLKEGAKRENMRRNFCGLGSPLHEAIVARFDAATVAAIECDAMTRFAERELRTAERKAAKKAGNGNG